MQQFLLYAIPSFFAGFALTYLLTPWIAKRMLKLRIVGVDIHKLDKPTIPEMCGLSIIVALTTSTIALMIYVPAYRKELIAFLASTLWVGSVGILDDLKPLNPKIKPLLTALAAAPILALGAYSPHPNLPLIGATRLTIVYPLLVPFAIAVPSNAVNMMDVFNGAMSGTCSVVAISMIICFALVGRVEEAALASALLGCLIGFHKFNRYPAKVFAGDTGSLYVGSAIGALAIIGKIEVPVMVAMMPHIMNAFYGLSSIGRLYERREIASRPTTLLGEGRLEVGEDKAAPITLARIILAQGPLRESEIVKAMVILEVICAVFAVITLFFTPR